MFSASPFLHLHSHQVTGYVYGFDYVAMNLVYLSNRSTDIVGMLDICGLKTYASLAKLLVSFLTVLSVEYHGTTVIAH